MKRILRPTKRISKIPVVPLDLYMQALLPHLYWSLPSITCTITIDRVSDLVIAFIGTS